MAYIDEYHGISKEEAVEVLNKKGYPAIWKDGVVEIALSHNGTTHTATEIQKTLKEIDYRMSYGYNYHPEAAVSVTS